MNHELARRSRFAADHGLLLRKGTSAHLPPARLDARFVESDLALAWTRRSRWGWHWVDESDAPLVEANEKYDLEIAGRNGSIQRTLDRPVARVPASELARIGPGGATVHVRQIGDWAMSRPTQMQVTLPKEKP